MKRTLKWFLYFLTFIGFLWFAQASLYIGGAFLFGVPSGKSMGICSAALDKLKDVHEFSMSTIRPKREAIGCSPASKGIIERPHRIRIYYILSQNEQNEVIDKLKTIAKEYSPIFISLEFRDNEVWITREGGGGHRGSEKTIREYEFKI